MKKLATLLAVLLLISCAPASAVETALTGAEAYQQYGPWYTWTQEQKDTATAEENLRGRKRTRASRRERWPPRTMIPAAAASES